MIKKKAAKKAKIYSGEEALQKMGLVTFNSDKLNIEETREQLLNIRRHLKGATKTVESYLSQFAFTPKCKECYENYGYINKCECGEKKS